MSTPLWKNEKKRVALELFLKSLPFSIHLSLSLYISLSLSLSLYTSLSLYISLSLSPYISLSHDAHVLSHQNNITQTVCARARACLRGQEGKMKGLKGIIYTM